MPGLGGGWIGPSTAAWSKLLPISHGFFSVAHAVLQVAPGHVEAERVAVDVVERLLRPEYWCRPISAPPPVRPRGDSSWSARDRDDRRPRRSRRSGSRRSASGRRTAARESGSDPRSMRVRGIIAPDAIDAADRKHVGLADDRDRRRANRKNRFRAGLRCGRTALHGRTRQRQRAGCQDGPAIDMCSWASSLFCRVFLSVAYLQRFRRKVDSVCALLHCNRTQRRKARVAAGLRSL